MSEVQGNRVQRPSRRTIAKGAAWAVPVVAIGAPAMALAASGNVPPPPVIDFGGACANTGATQKGCGGDKTLQVPLTIVNDTGADITFVIREMVTCVNCSADPVAGFPGVVRGVRGIWKTPAITVPNQNVCTTAPASCPAPGANDFAIGIPASTNGVPQTFWIESLSLGAASNFRAVITWQMLGADCQTLDAGVARTGATAISPANCNGG